VSKRVTRTKDVLIVVALFGLVAIVIRLVFGLGASTALSDAVPWGLWKILNMVAGVALATGGFTLACAVYVFGLEKYRPLLRPAILIALLGYGSSCFALLLDIGLPHRIWHAIVYWNEHSFLFEVAWCIMLYLTVTIVEMMPILLEKFPYPRLVRILHKITIPVVIAGITLSTLHHSSLGSLFLVAPSRLHEIWYTSLLPVLFFVSAIGGGMMAVVLLTILHAWLYEGQPPWAALRGVAAVAAVALALHAVIKIIDISYRGVWGSALDGSPESILLLSQMLLGSVIPCILVVARRSRNAPIGLAVASSSAVFGLVLNRVNVGIFGFSSSAGVFYLPSALEWALSLGIVAMAALAFLFITEQFEIYHLEPIPQTKRASGEQPVTDLGEPLWYCLPGRRLARVTLLPVIVVPVAVIVFWGDALRGYPLEQCPVVAPTALDPGRETLRIDGNANGDFVVFDHARHQEDFGHDDSCCICHHVHMPSDDHTACHRCHKEMHRPTSIFRHDLHIHQVGLRILLGAATSPERQPDLGDRRSVRAVNAPSEQFGLMAIRMQNRSCTECHDPARPNTPDTARACVDCHGSDMGIETEQRVSFNARAVGYVDALHDLCIACHQKQAPELKRPELAECTTCHPHSSYPPILPAFAPR
jgi:Ni/Fe-hydrogenase subunit HybB-like protein